MSTAGLSKARLSRMADVMRGYIERGEVAGSFGRDGSFHTSCYVDPHEDMVAILLAQRLMTSPTPSDFYVDFWTLAYQAIDD